MKLIIQIPCYNEEKTLPQTLADLPRKIQGIDTIEYLIINNGSIDNTVKAAIENGVDHVVELKKNKGLAAGFMAGLDACLKLGADIIINTDADNQYCGADIEKIVKPILDGKYDIVIGNRPIDEIKNFSKNKKILQHFGSFVVRIASGTDCPDAPSGFRAFSREAALRINVYNKYTYTLETIIQAGKNDMAIGTVAIRTNPQTRKSRLFKSTFSYVRRSSGIILRTFMIYRPMIFFNILSSLFLLTGFIIAMIYLFFFLNGWGIEHIRLLMLSCVLILFGAQVFIVGLQSDIISANRKLLEEIEYRVRKMDCDAKDVGKEN